MRVSSTNGPDFSMLSAPIIVAYEQLKDCFPPKSTQLRGSILEILLLLHQFTPSEDIVEPV